MTKKTGTGDVLRCSFCNKSQRDVKKLIAGPTVYICDECVEVCNDIVADDNRYEQKGAARPTLLGVPGTGSEAACFLVDAPAEAAR